MLIANGVVLSALLALLFSIPVGQSVLRVGSVADETIVARHKTTYVNRVATAAKRKQAMSAVSADYESNSAAVAARIREAAKFLAAAQPIATGTAPFPYKQTQVAKLLPPDVPNNQLQQFVDLSANDYAVVRDRSMSLLTQAQDWHFDSNQVDTTEIALLSTVSPHVTPLQRTAIGEVVSTFLEPTLAVNTQGTEQRQRAAANAVPPVISTIYPGEVIVRRGDVVNKAAMEKLAALGLQQRGTNWQDLSASLLFAVISAAMLFWYLHAFHLKVAQNPRLVLLIDAALLITVLLTRFVGPSHVLLPYFIPVAATTTFAAVLIGPEAAVALALGAAILAGWVTANSFELTTYYFLTSAAGVLTIRHVRQLKQFMLAGAAIMVFAFLTELAFGLVGHTLDLSAVQDYVLAAIFNGFVSSTLALGGFALLSGFFGVTTTLHLLELAQPSQPLLRRLMVKAPGTHNHSLIVGSMVEHAAEEIGADSLVAKVGALYHDVGKTANPHCFVENQLGEGNIHDELRPDESARLIRGHVILGLRLARQFKLPGAILDAIAEHHGTMSIAYFLHRARERSGDPIDMSLYTYPGPKPRSKETALIMLADGCESAVRASSDRSNDRMREIVDRIFQERVELGQLSECPLTIRDLEVAREAFLSVLSGLYHPRVDYPEPAPHVPISIRGRGIAR